MQFLFFFFYSNDADGTKFFHGPSVSTGPGQRAFIFISYSILPLHLTATQIHSDGTFKSVPGLFDQLYTLQVKAYGKVRNFIAHFYLFIF